MASSKIQQTEFGKKGFLPIFPGEEPIKEHKGAKLVTIYDSEAALKRDYPAGRRQPRQYAEVELTLTLKKVSPITTPQLSHAKKRSHESGRGRRQATGAAKAAGSVAGTVKASKSKSAPAAGKSSVSSKRGSTGRSHGKSTARRRRTKGAKSG